MVGSSYAKVTATTLMTHYERRRAKQMAKDARNGVREPSAALYPTQPRRAGLRGVKYAFSNNEAPRRVVPRAPEATQPRTIPIPCLEGQEGMLMIFTVLSVGFND
jgi:hypothetical protein